MIGKQDDKSLCRAQCIHDFLAPILPTLDLFVKPDVDTARGGNAYEPLRERTVGAAVAQKNIASHLRSLLRFDDTLVTNTRFAIILPYMPSRRFKTSLRLEMGGHYLSGAMQR